MPGGYRFVSGTCPICCGAPRLLFRIQVPIGVERTPKWHCGGQGFESPRLHHPSLSRESFGGPDRWQAMFYACILRSLSSPDQLYHGHSSDLKQCLAEHNSGRCPHTAKFVPRKVKFYAAFETLESAQRVRTIPQERLWPRLREAASLAATERVPALRPLEFQCLTCLSLICLSCLRVSGCLGSHQG